MRRTHNLLHNNAHFFTISKLHRSETGRRLLQYEATSYLPRNLLHTGGGGCTCVL
jgi:hypothetical protein